jgi:hypothetical protein
MMNNPQMYPVPETWDNPPSLDNTNNRPRKKRRKYIAKAWLVWKVHILFEIEG